MVQNIGVGGANRVIDHLVAHKALIHIGVLRIGAGAGRIGGKYQSGDIQFATGLRQPNEVFGQLVRQHILNAVLPIGRRIVRVDLALMMQFEGAMRVRQRDAGKHFGAMRVLRRIGFEKFAPCGCIEIQIRHLYPRTDPTRCRRNLPRAAVVLNATGVCRRIGARGHAHIRYRGDRGQRLTAKPHGFDVLQLVQRADFARRVARHGQGQLLGRYAATIVRNFDQRFAAIDQAQSDVGRARIQRVFQQLLDHRCRPLDHFAGGNLADELVG